LTHNSDNENFRIVYLGSPQFAVPPLKALLAAGYDVPLVVTQPDRPKGRKRQLTPTDVKLAAEEVGIRTLAVADVNVPEVVAEIVSAKPDLLVVAAFGQLLKEPLLQAAKLGAINIHGSLLPEYRGASPIQQALIDGRDETGVTIMYIAKKLDAGDMLSSETCRILPDDNTGSLRERLSDMGAALLLKTITEMREGAVKPVPQDEAYATYAGKITAEQERLDWNLSAVSLHNLVRGLTPDTSAYTCYDEQGSEVRFKIWRTELADSAEKALPGTVVAADKKGLLVACGEGCLRLVNVQPSGKGQMDAAAWWRGRRDLAEVGLRFK
jgi:methionyl-tRNA formyltransferase